MSRITGVFGDQGSPNYRSALEGNAMLFNTTRWVELQAGADPLPSLGNQVSYTVLIAARVVSSQNDGNGVYVFSQENANGLAGFNMWNQGFGLVYNGATKNNTTAYFRYSTITNHYGRRGIFFCRNRGGRNTNTMDNIYNGRNLPIAFSGNNLPSNVTFAEVIRIGERQFGGAQFRFGSAHIRRFEILVGTALSDAGLRAAFNYGSIISAHQAGAISIANLTDLISIDFNRLNGQAPICVPGTKQLVVQPYNNLTPDTAGTTYANWYSL